jgi:hypothetical protein
VKKAKASVAELEHVDAEPDPVVAKPDHVDAEPDPVVAKPDPC